MDTPPSLRPRGVEDMLCFDVYAANLAFARLYKPLLDPLGLTYPQYLALLTLWTGDDRTVGEVGAALGLESSTLTPLLKRLEAAGLVARVRDRGDERRVRVRLTDKGRALEGEAACIPERVARAAGMDLAEFLDLKSRLGRLRRALEAATPGG